MLKIGILHGDDIGLEVVPEAVKVMRAAAAKTGLEIEWQELPIGVRGHELHGHTMPRFTVAAAQLIDAAMDRVIAEARHLTADLGGSAATTQMGDAVVEALRWLASYDDI